MGLWWSEVQILSPRPSARQEAILQNRFLPYFMPFSLFPSHTLLAENVATTLCFSFFRRILYESSKMNRGTQHDHETTVGTLSGGQVTDLSCAPPIYRP